MTPGDGQFNYDSIAENYAAGVDSAPYNALYERPAMMSLLPSVENQRILDAGCGSGWYAEQLLARGAIVSAVDASAAMVEHARRRLAALPGSDPARWSADVRRLDEHLPFDDDFFAGAVSPLVLHYMRDWRPALREIRRVLMPGGWFLLSTHHPAADAARYETRNYFSTEPITDHWEWVGRVQFFRRSFTEIFASLADTGFQVRTVVEPIPTEKFRETNPESYERIMRIPEFLIVLAFLP